MDRNELIAKLKALQGSYDQETAHVEADELLLRYINDREIEEAYGDIPKWYA